METKTKYIKHVFSEDEKRDLATDLAQKIMSKNSLELKKKEVAAQIKAEIDATESLISKLSTHYNQGYTFMDIKCRVERDYENKQVHYFRLGTGEHVESRAMTQDELQQELFAA